MPTLFEGKHIPLPLISKLISREIALGQHGSLRAGAGVEFDQYRNYQIGDDFKTIDLKKYMQAGKLISRQSTADRRLLVNIILDISPSMAYSEQNMSRFTVAKTIAASFAFAAHRQGDELKTMLLKNEAYQPITKKGNTINAQIAAINDAQISNDELALKLDNLQCTNQILVLISDFLGDLHTLTKKISQWANAGNEIYVFQILGEKERHFNFVENQTFVGLEDLKDWPSDTKTLKATYLKNFDKHQEQLLKAFKHKNICFGEISIADKLIHKLPEILKSQPWRS